MAPTDTAPEGLASFVADLLPAEAVAARVAPVEAGPDESPVDPARVTRVLLYGWAVGLTSSRLLARALETDAAFRALSGGARWSHRTLIRFREENDEALRRTLVDALQGCRAHLPYRVGRLAIPAASDPRGTLDEDLAFLFGEVAEIDREEDTTLGEPARGDETPVRPPPPPESVPPVPPGELDELGDLDLPGAAADPNLLEPLEAEDPPPPAPAAEPSPEPAPSPPPEAVPEAAPEPGPAAPPKDLHVMVLPWSHTLAPGETVQFRASAFDSRGKDASVTPRWEADGGEIGEDGTFRAGQTAGTFEVRARDQWSGSVGRAKVTVEGSGRAAPPEPAPSPPPARSEADGDPTEEPSGPVDAAPPPEEPAPPLAPEPVGEPAPPEPAAAAPSVTLRVDRTFWKPGVLKQEVTVRPTPEGEVKHGAYQTWHANGALHTEGRYQEGKESGTWTRWYENGNKELTVRFQEGVKHGVLRIWGPDQKPREVQQWWDGQRHGIQVTWSGSGHPTGRVWEWDQPVRDLTVPEIAEELRGLEREERLEVLCEAMEARTDRGPGGESRALLDLLGQADAAERGANLQLAEELRTVALLALERRGVEDEAGARQLAAAVFALSKQLLRTRQPARVVEVALPRLPAIAKRYGAPDRELAGLLYTVGTAGLEAGSEDAMQAGLRALEVADVLGDPESPSQLVFLKLALQITRRLGDHPRAREVEARIQRIDPDALPTPEKRALAQAVRKGVIDAAATSSTGPGKLARLAVLPKSRLMSVGDGFRFRVFGYDALDEPVAVQPRWEAEGGEIRDDGQYRATEPGTFALVARDHETGLEAEASVTVQGDDAA